MPFRSGLNPPKRDKVFLGENHRSNPGAGLHTKTRQFYFVVGFTGWLTTCMELGADILNDFFYRTAIDLSFLNLLRAPIYGFVPPCFCISVHCVIQAGDKLVGKKRPDLVP